MNFLFIVLLSGVWQYYFCDRKCCREKVAWEEIVGSVELGSMTRKSWDASMGRKWQEGTMEGSLGSVAWEEHREKMAWETSVLW